MARTYDSRGRRERSALTRRAIVDAAVALFAERGWSATTMTLVAERAGVAVETVYRAVPGGKSALLAAAVHAAVAGGAEDAESPLEHRTEIRRALDIAGPHEALRRYAATLPGAHRRTGPLLAAADTADAADVVARVRADLESQRLDGMRRFAQDLADARALRDGLTVDAAADTLWAVCSRSTFDALVGRRTWRDEDYTAWVTRLLAAELLHPA